MKAKDIGSLALNLIGGALAVVVLKMLKAMQDRMYFEYVEVEDDSLDAEISTLFDAEMQHRADW